MKYLYGGGIFGLIIGAAGMAEAINGNGSFMIAAIIFSMGFGLVLASYVDK